MAIPKLSIEVETFPVAGTFTISRGARREATVVVATLDDGGVRGRGECVPYGRYGESVDSVVAQIRSAEGIGDRLSLQSQLPAGAARNALDCALWDIEAKRGSSDPARTAGGAAYPTCYTLSLAAPDVMASCARAAADKGLLKLKLGGGMVDAQRLRAVRAARPDARLVADANEAWELADLMPLLQVARETGLELIEQPLPVGLDAALAEIEHPVPICADESAHTSRDIAQLRGRYDAVNIKLDKAGGLTEALVMLEAAHTHDLRIMIGCMLSTSLAMAPALRLAEGADWLDLDGPLLLAADREPAIVYRDGCILPAPPGLWG